MKNFNLCVFGGVMCVLPMASWAEGDDLGVESPGVHEVGEAVTDEGPIHELATYHVFGVGIGHQVDNINDAMHYEQFGAFNENNAAEVLNRLPGISLERDQGDGRFVIIRGIDPVYNGFTLDGIPVGATSAESRAAQLDTIETEGLDGIEIFKVLTPDQPSDSVGGLINFSTPSAFDYRGRHAQLEGSVFFHDLTDKFGGKTSFRYGELFADDKVGLFVTGSFNDRPLASDSVEVDPFDLVDGFFAPVGAVEYREFNLLRQRYGVSASLEYKPRKDSLLFLRTSFSQLDDEEERNQTVVDFEDAVGEGSVTATGNSLMFINDSGGPADDEDDDVSIESQYREEVTTTQQFLIRMGGEHTSHLWSIDYAGSLGLSSEEEDQTALTYALSDVPDSITLSGTNSRTPGIAFAGGIDPTTPGNYELDEILVEQNQAEEVNWGGQVNVKREFVDKMVEYVKAGALVQFREKDNDVMVSEFSDGPARFDTLTRDAGLRDFTGTRLPGVAASLQTAFNEARGDFDSEVDLEESIPSDFDSTENTYAGYLMTGLSFNHRLKVIGGFRVEHTTFDSESQSFDASTSTGTPISQGNDYTHFLPGIHIRYRSQDTVDSVDAWGVRASWTNTIGRPGFEETKAGLFIEDDEVEIGNPQLDPLESMNFDLSFRYEHQDWGFFSVSGFYKDIDNFIFTQVQNFDFDFDTEDEEVKTFLNGDSANVMGLELAYEKALVALPGPLSGLIFSGSLTFIDSDGAVQGRDLPLVRQSDFLGKVSLTWAYRSWLARLSYVYRSEYLDEVGETALEDFYVDAHGQLDLSVNYFIGDSWLIFGRIDNLTNEPFEAFWGTSGRVAHFEEYGVSGVLGVKWIY